MRRVALVAIPVAFLLALAAIHAETRPPGAETAFPHEQHAGLFFDCSSCHAGIDEGNPYSVTAEQCATCHNGVVKDEVVWSPPVREAGNLKFDHVPHLAQPDLACTSCHGADASTRKMDVTLLSAEECRDCHGVEDHYAATGDCAYCHVPLREAAGLPLEAVAAFETPADHRTPAFLEMHGEAALANTGRCATCHTKELCERCHLNADSLAVIQALGSDPRLLPLFATVPGAYPTPADHLAGDWDRVHGEAALASTAACANCHARESCTRCHGGEIELAAIAALAPGGTPPRGVQLPDGHPPLHGAGFETEHAVAAGARDPDCEVCHRVDFCEDCHVSPSTPSFHMVDYVSRHASDAYAREQDCASCHSPEVFCRSCHIQVGTSPEPLASNAFHDKWGNWLIAHAPLARQSIEACASCHQQDDCLRCHSQAGWGVNPHGPGFDAERMRDKNPLLCARCHFD